MKKIFFIIVVSVLCSTLIVAQSVGINNTTPHASAILDIKSNTKGMLIPRTSSASRIAITGPAKGLMIYDTTTSSFWFYNGGAWISVADGSNTWVLSGNTGTNAATNFIGTTDSKPLRFRVNNAWAGEIHPNSGNVFLGIGAGQANTGGQFNTAIGEHSLFTNTIGADNSAYGAYTLNSNTAGSENTANGSLALFYNSTGSWNTAIGDRALYDNTTGNKNTATGSQALVLNSTGNENTATGYRSLFSNTTGTSNTATGADALLTNNTGNFNSAHGYQALYLNTTGAANTANGYKSLYSNTSGNENTATGFYALYSNSTGFGNTSYGNESLYSNTIGNYNSANGYRALYSNTSGNENTANGTGALYINTTGNHNTATGSASLYSNTTGNDNTANGYQALASNTTGAYNTATGNLALTSNTTAISNTANGYKALYSNSTGSYNTAAGTYALSDNTVGSSNTAFGSGALNANITGSSNIAIGDNALYKNIGGSYNIAIGHQSGIHPSTPNIYNTISIGNDDMANAYQNQVFIGNTSTGFIGGKVPWSVISDARVKNTITEDVKGLDFIMKLRPVTYHVSNKAITTLTGNKETPDFPGKYDGEKIKYSGFLAQEVEQAAKSAGYDFSGYAAPKNQWSLYTLSYEQFVVPLVKGMQEQQVIIEQLQKELKRLRIIEERLSVLENQNKK